MLAVEGVGDAETGYGMLGKSTDRYGEVGESSNWRGVAGTGSEKGVLGMRDKGRAVVAQSTIVDGKADKIME
jgi:hypothetical protein